MPARLIRDDMLDSERLQTLPIEARWLYVAVLLTADDVGLLEVSPFRLARRAGLDQQKIPVLLQLLADSDLIRFYEVAGKRYGFIPRFRQRLQIKRSRCPAPPVSLIADDSDASNKIKGLGSNPPLCSSGKPKSTVVQPPEPEPEPEPRNKDKDTRATRFDRFWNAYPSKVGKDAARKAFEKRNPDEQLLSSMLDAIASQSGSEKWHKDGGQYIPNPATWLNQGRWQDGTGVSDVQEIFARGSK